MAFDFTELPTAIRKTWDAVVPPATELALCSVLVIYIVGWSSVSEMLYPALALNNLVPSSNVQEALKFYGLASLIPFAIVISVLVFAHAVGRLVRWAGRLVPGYLVPNTTEQIYGALDEWDLRRIWACHPDLDDVNGLNTLNVIIDEEVARASSDPKGHHRLKGVAESTQFANRYRERIDFAKGLFIVSGASWAVTPAILDGATRPTNRLWIVVGILVAWILWNAVRYLSAEEELARFRVRAYLDAKGSRLKDGGEPNSANWGRDSARIEMLKRAQLKGEVWAFHLLKPGVKTNAKRQLLRAFRRFIDRGLLKLAGFFPARNEAKLKQLGGKAISDEAANTGPAADA